MLLRHFHFSLIREPRRLGETFNFFLLSFPPLFSQTGLWFLPHTHAAFLSLVSPPLCPPSSEETRVIQCKTTPHFSCHLNSAVFSRSFFPLSCSCQCDSACCFTCVLFNQVYQGHSQCRLLMEAACPRHSAELSSW